MSRFKRARRLLADLEAMLPKPGTGSCPGCGRSTSRPDCYLDHLAAESEVCLCGRDGGYRALVAERTSQQQEGGRPLR